MKKQTGKRVMIIGIIVFLLNFITYTYFNIDIDIIGAIIFVIGLVIWWRGK